MCDSLQSNRILIWLTKKYFLGFLFETVKQNYSSIQNEHNWPQLKHKVEKNVKLLTMIMSQPILNSHNKLAILRVLHLTCALNNLASLERATLELIAIKPFQG